MRFKILFNPALISVYEFFHSLHFGLHKIPDFSLEYTYKCLKYLLKFVELSRKNWILRSYRLTGNLLFHHYKGQLINVA
jgi:hypothetical protein